MTDERPTHLDLFSGIGGFALAAQWAGFRTIGFCEIDPYCQRVLAKNFGADLLAGESSSAHAGGGGDKTMVSAQSACDSERRVLTKKVLADAKTARLEGRCQQQAQLESKLGFRQSGSPITPNIFELDGRDFAGVSLITGGFPCQPFSCAGKRRGKEDDRHLWPEMCRVIAEARPDWIVGENVTGIIGMELDQVLSDLENLNYACQAFIVPACAVDAPHRRMRVWIVAKSNAERCGRRENHERQDAAERNGPASASHVADSDEPGSQGRNCGVVRERAGERSARPGNSSIPDAERNGSHRARWDASGGCSWLPEPDVGRVAHGIPARVDRLRGLGNAIVPQVAYQILKAIQ